MKRFKAVAVKLVIIIGILSTITTVALPQSVQAACKTSFFGLPAWYDGLTDEDCDVVRPGGGEDGLSKFIWKIVLNVIEAFLMVVGYVSVAFLIVGGYKYMVATGSPDKIKAAKDTIRNAVIGLVIALGSVAIVNAIAGAL